MFTKDEESQVEVVATSEDSDASSKVSLASAAVIVSTVLGLMVIV